MPATKVLGILWASNRDSRRICYKEVAYPFLFFLIHFCHFFSHNSFLFLEASQPTHAHLTPSLPSSVLSILRHENSSTPTIIIGREKEREKERDRERERLFIHICFKYFKYLHITYRHMRTDNDAINDVSSYYFECILILLCIYENSSTTTQSTS